MANTVLLYSSASMPAIGADQAAIIVLLQAGMKAYGNLRHIMRR